jgi:hypothetical protein
MEKLKRVYRRIADKYPRLDGFRPSRLFFGNIRSLGTNLRYLRYHQACQKGPDPLPSNGLRSKAEELGKRFREQGYVILHPNYGKELIPFLAKRCEELVLEKKTSILEGDEEWFINILNSMTVMPEIRRLINPEVEAVLKACFGSQFKIYSSEVYRTTPTNDPPTASGLWHTDNYPPGIYKVMVYLTPCDRNTGALRIHPMPSTRRLLREGFFNRSKAERFMEKLERNSIHIEGPPGTVLIWNSNVIHKATPPKTGLRDLVAFKLVPSNEPWEKHLDRMGDKINHETRNSQIPADPAAD